MSELSLNDFQKAALRTWNSGEPSRDRRTMNAALGLGGETGEVLDLLKKAYFHGKQIPLYELITELGDVLYYVAVLCHENGYTLEDSAKAVTDKLNARHPNGFDPSYHQEK